MVFCEQASDANRFYFSLAKRQRVMKNRFKKPFGRRNINCKTVTCQVKDEEKPELEV